MSSRDYRALDLTLTGHARVQAFFKNYTALNPTYKGFDLELLQDSLVLVSAADGASVFELTVKDVHTNGLGNLHGGCAALVYDICTSAALISAARAGFWEFVAVSRNLSVTYIRPVPAGTAVRIESEVVHAGRQLATIRGVMRTVDGGKVVSTAEHTKVDLTELPAARSSL